MLKIIKQAHTAAEAQAALDASYQVENPFGVPVLLVDPVNYPPVKVCGIPLPLLARHAHKKVAAFIDRLTPSHDLPGKVTEIAELIISNLRAHRHNRETLLAESYRFKAPELAVIFHACTKNAVREQMQYALMVDARTLPEFPGTDAEYNFLSLWHEIAHSVAGPNEAGADLTSAMAFRHAFTDTAPLKLSGDLRAAHAVVNYRFPKVLESYGWSCVDAFDSVAAMKEPPSWEQVYQVGSTSHIVDNRSRADAITYLGKTLREVAIESLHNRNLGKLADMTDTLLQHDQFPDQESALVASRFALAARRLSIGRAAYAAP